MAVYFLQNCNCEYSEHTSWRNEVLANLPLIKHLFFIYIYLLLSAILYKTKETWSSWKQAFGNGFDIILNLS